MLKSKISISDNELSMARKKNMQNWKEEDIQFYEGFFDDNLSDNTKIAFSVDHSKLNKAPAVFRKTAWLSFQQFLKKTNSNQ